MTAYYRIRFITSIGSAARELRKREVELLQGRADLLLIAGNEQLSVYDIEPLAGAFRQPLVFVPGGADAAQWHNDRERDLIANRMALLSAKQIGFRYLDDMELSLSAYGGPAIRLIGTPCVARSAYVPPPAATPFSAIDAILRSDYDTDVSGGERAKNRRRSNVGATRFDAGWLRQRLSTITAEPCIVCTTGLPSSAAQLISRSPAAPIALLMGGERIGRSCNIRAIDFVLSDQFEHDCARVVAFDGAGVAQVAENDVSSRVLRPSGCIAIAAHHARPRRWWKGKRARNDYLRESHPRSESSIEYFNNSEENEHHD